MNELWFMNACGLLTFGIEPDGLPDFPLLHEMLEGLEAFLSRGVTSLGGHHGLHVTDGTGDKHLVVALGPTFQSGCNEGSNGFAASDVPLFLKDHHGENEEFLRVVGTIDCAIDEGCKDGQEGLG